MLFEPNEQGLVLSGAKPVTIGHEAVGEILEVGSETVGFQPGDMVKATSLYVWAQRD